MATPTPATPEWTPAYRIQLLRQLLRLNWLVLALGLGYITTAIVLGVTSSIPNQIASSIAMSISGMTAVGLSLFNRWFCRTQIQRLTAQAG
jgi:hypothetical protein